MNVYFLVLTVLFFLFASQEKLWILCAAYVCDQAIHPFRLGLTAYAGRLAEGEERTRLLALGVTANHVGAVILPLAGGLLYAKFGYQPPFYCGMVVALLSLVLSRRLPKKREE